MNIYEQICKEWLKGCSCCSTLNPEQCRDCTNAFLFAVKFHNKYEKQLQTITQFIGEVELGSTAENPPTYHGISLVEIGQILQELVVDKKPTTIRRHS